MLTYGALCRGLLSGKLHPDAHFDGDDLRLTDPKFRTPLYTQYLTAVRGATTALWGARYPGQLQPIDEVFGWSLNAAAKVEIDRILHESIPNPLGPEFIAPPPGPHAEVLQAAE